MHGATIKIIHICVQNFILHNANADIGLLMIKVADTEGFLLSVWCCVCFLRMA